MRTIQIAEDTYKFLQSKAIPFEEQPDDTIKRLLGVGEKSIENQTTINNSNDSNALKGELPTEEKTINTQQSSRQSLRDFYSNILDKHNSKSMESGRESALNNHNSNKSLENRSNLSHLLEDNSNSNQLNHSNSKELSLEGSNSKLHSSNLFDSNIPVNQPVVSSTEKYSNISNSGGTAKGKKKPKTSLPELVRDGLVKENERVYFQNYRGVKFPQYEVTVADGQLKWNGNRYSMSDLASKILKDLDPKQDNDFVRGPVLWVNAAGKTMADLWDIYLAKKGV
ncbi:hypothetical protein [Paraflavitalea pollutisoli]|uniref:hypothetical protein n=1 Tax=Paraflavitalea pollutisoli TaxID=3034143 RepID=UPI0023ED7742|nr:hypothetical protein [Paraflavitalea sp. H1-2-19X]